MVAPTVTGDPEGIRGAGRELGGRAQAADGQARRIRLASDTVGLPSFQGGAADRVRGFLGSLAQVSTEIGRAYERIGTVLPRVAGAVHDAQQAEQKKDKAEKALADARKDVTSAQEALTAAQLALLAARATAKLAAVVHQHVSTAAQEHAVEQARAALDRAQDTEQDAARAAKRAQQDFEDKDRARDRASRELARLAKEVGAQVGALVGGLPDAPQPPALAGQIGVLGYGQGFFKTAFDLTEALARADLGLGKVGGVPVQGPLGPSAARSIAQLDRMVKIAKFADGALAFGGPLASHTITALSNPNLSRKDRIRDIFGPSAIEGGMAYGFGALGTAACGPVCGFAAGTAGGKIGEHVAKIKTVRSLTDAVADDVISEKLKPFEDLYHGRIKDAAVDEFLSDGRIAYNLTKRGAHIVTHPGDDVKFVVQAGKDLDHEAAKVSTFVPGNPVGVAHQGVDGVKDITEGHVGRGAVKILSAPVTAPLEGGKKVLDGLGIHL